MNFRNIKLLVYTLWGLASYLSVGQNQETLNEIALCKKASTYLNEKFDSYNIIGLDEGPHGTVRNHKFFLEMLSNDDLAKKIQIIILEFMSNTQQVLLDRFINGDDVSISDLRLVWRESTQAHSVNIENPVYLNLLVKIRELNSRLENKDKIRVLGGDPSANWAAIKTLKDYFPTLSQRDVLPSELAIKYGIKENKNVLLIYGGEHLLKTSDSKRDSTHWTIPYYINKKYPKSIWTIGFFNSKTYKYNKNEIHLRANTIYNTNGKIGELETAEGTKLSDVFDAVYYLGDYDHWPVGNIESIDSEFWNELNRRSKILWGQGIDETFKKK